MLMTTRRSLGRCKGRARSSEAMGINPGTRKFLDSTAQSFVAVSWEASIRCQDPKRAPGDFENAGKGKGGGLRLEWLGLSSSSLWVFAFGFQA